MGEKGAGRAVPGSAARWRVWGMLAIALALGGAATLHVGFDPPALVGVAYVAAVTGTLWATDAREHRLPNALVLPGYAFAGVALVWEWLARDSPPWEALACCAVTLLAFAAFAVTGGFGMGDVKLAGLLALVWGADAGAAAVVVALGVALVAAGIVALGIVALELVALTAQGHPDARRGDLPLGPFLLAGFWCIGLWP